MKNEFCKKFKTQFSILTLNINGLPKKKDELEILLDTLQFNFDIVALTETHLNPVTEKYSPLKNYRSFFNSRRSNTWGGVAVFYKPHLTCERINDLDLNTEGVLESLFIEISSKGEKTILGVVYRPPNSNTTDFLNKLNEIVFKFKDKKLHLVGDFNLDLLKSEQHSLTNDFLTDINSMGLQPTISLPTRIAPTSATLIDNILTTDYHKPITSGIICSNISDHLPIFSIIGNSGSPLNNYPKHILKRDLRDEN